MRLATLLVLAAIPLAAHADTIDDFTFTDGTHTIQYSLPATNTTKDFQTFTNFTASSIATIDGVSGYSISGQYFDLPFAGGITAVLNLPSGNPFFTTQIVFTGALLTSYTAVPASNPSPYLPYNIVSTFTPGIYTLKTQPFGFPAATDTFTLTIAPESSPVPEPSTLALLATGTLTVLSRRKIRNRCQRG